MNSKESGARTHSQGEGAQMASEWREDEEAADDRARVGARHKAGRWARGRSARAG